jgi:hypothetical protein
MIIVAFYWQTEKSNVDMTSVTTDISMYYMYTNIFLH